MLSYLMMKNLMGTKRYTITTAIQHSIESSSQHNKAKKPKEKIKGMQVGKGEEKNTKLPISDNVVVYVQSTKESTKIPQNDRECSARLYDPASTQTNQLGLYNTVCSPSTKNEILDYVSNKIYIGLVC